MNAFSRAIGRRPARVLLAALLVAAACALLASRLRLETDLVALLPEGAPEAVDYSLFLELFGGFEKVFVVIVADDSAAETVDQGELLSAAEELAEKLGESSEISAIRTGLEPEDEEFFLRYVVRRSALLVPVDTLSEFAASVTPEALDRRAAELRAQLSSPSGALTGRLAIYDPLGLSGDLPLLAAGSAGLPIDPWTGAFSSPDGDASLLVLTPAGGELDADGGRRLLKVLEGAFAELAKSTPGVRAMAVGGPLYAAQDETLVRADMEKTVFGSIAGCAVILLLAFRGFWIPNAAVAVLGLALLATAAALAMILGSVTAAGLGFAAVLVGLGMDYGIHGGTRFRQARLAGEDPVASVTLAFRDAGPGIATSALTTAAAFATLGVAHFRPLRELGVVVASGILAILAATATFGAALLVLRPGVREPGFLWLSMQVWVDRLTTASSRRPRLVLTLAFLATVGAAAGVSQLALNPDLAAMRPANNPVFETERLLVERFNLGIDTATVIVPGENLDEALLHASEVKQRLETSGGAGLSVLSATDWLVAEPSTRERLAEFEAAKLGPAADRLEAALASHNLAPAAFEPGLSALRALAAGQDPGAPGREDWPLSLGELLAETEDGRVFAALRIRLQDGEWASGPPEQLWQEIQEIAPGSVMASAPRLGQAMKRVASQDIKSLAAIGLALVALVVGISFRGELVACLLSGVPVALGTLWALGFWGASGRTLDLLSLSVVPILLGIGIDDGLHAVHGARHREAGTAHGKTARFDMARLRPSVASAGLAMTLTTLTTCVGFGSLMFSSIPGLASGGLLVSLGVLACLVATLTVLPALGALRS